MIQLILWLMIGGLFFTYFAGYFLFAIVEMTKDYYNYRKQLNSHISELEKGQLKSSMHYVVSLWTVVLVGFSLIIYLLFFSRLGGNVAQWVYEVLSY